MSSPSERSPQRDAYSGRPTDGSLEQVGISRGQKPVQREYGHGRLPGRGLGRVGLQELLTQLSARDVAVLELVAEHRLLTTRHLESFCFHDHASPLSGARTARRVLARLERLGLIERTVRRVGGLQAGSSSSTWMLTSTGQRLRSIRDGRGAVGKVREPGERFIAHYLAIADARLALVQAERAGQLLVIQSVIEPRAWRSFTTLGGGTEILKPDLAAITAPSKDAEFEDHWFIEIDRGTESLPTLIKQCRRYENYRRSGEAQQADGVFPIIVWVVPDGRRASKLTERIASTRGLNAAHYRVTTPVGFVELIKVGAA